MKDKKSKDFQVASSQELTGLIPSGPVKEEDLALYEELYPFYPPLNCIRAASKKEDDKC